MYNNALRAYFRIDLQNAPAPDAAVVVPERPAFMDALAAEVTLPADAETYVPLLPPAPPSPPPTSPTLLPGLFVQARCCTPRRWFCLQTRKQLHVSNSICLGSRAAHLSCVNTTRKESMLAAGPRPSNFCSAHFEQLCPQGL